MERGDRLRRLIAQEAARILAEEGVHDPQAAKRKAAARLGAPNTRDLPRAEEIEAALNEHHRLFRSKEQAERIARLRRLALEAMRFLEEFTPWLVGGVWEGVAGRGSPIRLHLFPHTPEDVIRKLLHARIPYEESAGQLPFEGERGEAYPLLVFLVDENLVELLLLPPALKGQSLRRKNGRAPGGDRKALEKMLSADSA